MGGSAGRENVGGSGAAGTPSELPKPFSCPDPKPDDGIGWTVYTVQPGDCLVVGSSTWQGEQVCRETSTTDGKCDAKCANYLSVRVGLFDEPITIAVMPLFGIALTGPSDMVPGCFEAREGVWPYVE
jgi:hypothetical protein